MLLVATAAFKNEMPLMPGVSERWRLLWGGRRATRSEVVHRNGRHAYDMPGWLPLATRPTVNPAPVSRLAQGCPWPVGTPAAGRGGVV